MSPDVFLSRHGIKYDGSAQAPPGSPAEIVNSFLVLNGTRQWDPDYNDFVYTQYETPNFTPREINPLTFSRRLVQQEQDAMQAVFESYKTGNLTKVRKAVDTLNSIREKKGGVQFFPIPDYEILGHGSDNVGQVARWLVSDFQRAVDTNEPPPWFFTKAASDALSDYAEGKL